MIDRTLATPIISWKYLLYYLCSFSRNQ